MDEVETVFPPFQVTRAAIAEIERLGGAVRIELEEGGCCGLTYTYAKLPTDTQYDQPRQWKRQTGRALRPATMFA